MIFESMSKYKTFTAQNKNQNSDHLWICHCYLHCTQCYGEECRRGLNISFAFVILVHAIADCALHEQSFFAHMLVSSFVVIPYTCFKLRYFYVKHMVWVL